MKERPRPIARSEIELCQWSVILVGQAALEAAYFFYHSCRAGRLEGFERKGRLCLG
jgi:hypothetical protein